MAKIIKYKYVANEINHGTVENPDVEQILFDKTLGWSETAEEIAKREAYNGEYTIEDDGVLEPESPTESSVWDELDAAYQEGVDSV